MDWDVMNRLHEKGYIGNPKSKAKSVPLTAEGARLSETLIKKHFGLSSYAKRRPAPAPKSCLLKWLSL